MADQRGQWRGFWPGKERASRCTSRSLVAVHCRPLRAVDAGVSRSSAHGCYDKYRIAPPLRRLPQRCGLQSVDDLLGDQRVQIVLNLTNPRSHYAYKVCLQAGKHSIPRSRWPWTLPKREADRAWPSHAGCRSPRLLQLLGECAQTMWKAVRENRVGRSARLCRDGRRVGPPHALSKWMSEQRHAVALPGRVRGRCTVDTPATVSPGCGVFRSGESVTAFSSVQIPESTRTWRRRRWPPISRCRHPVRLGVWPLDCSIIAPHHAMRIWATMASSTHRRCGTRIARLQPPMDHHPPEDAAHP